MQDKALHVSFNPSDFQPLAFDVSKNSLNYYTEFRDRPRSECLESAIKNRNGDIRETIQHFSQMSMNRLGKPLLVVCEPTGGYEKQLMRVARELGAHTAYVSGVAVHRLTSIESNDSGKTDQKDCRTIFRLVQLETPLLNQRQLPSCYQNLRVINGYYEDEEQAIVQCRTRAHALVKDLMCDFSFDNKFIFSKGGDAFLKLYQFNPYLACKDGKIRFVERMRELCPKTKKKTLDRLWTDIDSSSRSIHNHSEIEVMTKRLQHLVDDWQKHVARKAAYRQQMCELFEYTVEYGRLQAIPKVDNFLLARIVAETGPLQDFNNVQQLLRYAGLNLREKQSGMYKGATRISKKGRSLLRKVLYQMTFGYLIKKKGLMRDYYEKKVADLKICKKAMVCIMRKFLRLVFGISRTQQAFKSSEFFRLDPVVVQNVA